MKTEDARAAVGQHAWEEFSKTAPPGFLRPEDRERYIELYLLTLEGTYALLRVQANDFIRLLKRAFTPKDTP